MISLHARPLLLKSILCLSHKILESYKEYFRNLLWCKFLFVHFSPCHGLRFPPRPCPPPLATPLSRHPPLLQPAVIHTRAAFITTFRDFTFSSYRPRHLPPTPAPLPLPSIHCWATHEQTPPHRASPRCCRTCHNSTSAAAPRPTSRTCTWFVRTRQTCWTTVWRIRRKRGLSERQQQQRQHRPHCPKMSRSKGSGSLRATRRSVSPTHRVTWRTCQRPTQRLSLTCRWCRSLTRPRPPVPIRPLPLQQGPMLHSNIPGILSLPRQCLSRSLSTTPTCTHFHIILAQILQTLDPFLGETTTTPLLRVLFMDRTWAKQAWPPWGCLVFSWTPLCLTDYIVLIRSASPDSKY